jgi:hypothetical protein
LVYALPLAGGRAGARAHRRRASYFSLDPVRALTVLLAALPVAAACHGPGTLDVAARLAAAAPRPLAPVGPAERDGYLRRARIFDDVDPAHRDLLAGPPDPHRFRFDGRVSCDFTEPHAAQVPARGTTPKFFCKLRHRDRGEVKVKYGRDNRELYGELLGSRLLWALGVATDADYAVRVRCHGCPADPWQAYRRFPRPDPSPRLNRDFDDALVQRLYPGLVIEARREQGWRFDELDAIDEQAGGASRADVDALRLLAAFIAHGDDKAENQRLVCPYDAVDAAGRCTRPRLLVADLGSTFGRGANGLGLVDQESRPSFAAWSTLPVWEDAAACRAHLAARASASNPVVGEAGRQQLAARLGALSWAQLHDLFAGARIERLGETTRDADGRVRPVTVDDWVRAFERRRDQIARARCPRP